MALTPISMTIIAVQAVLSTKYSHQRPNNAVVGALPTPGTGSLGTVCETAEQLAEVNVLYKHHNLLTQVPGFNASDHVLYPLIRMLSRSLTSKLRITSITTHQSPLHRTAWQPQPSHPRLFVRYTFNIISLSSSGSYVRITPSLPSPTSYLFVRSLSHVEQFTLQGEDAIAVSSDHSQATDGQCFGRVSLSKDQRTVLGVARAGVVGVLQLGDTCGVKRGV